MLEEAFKLAITIFDSGFRPDFIVGIWRGGSTVGIYVQECLQYLGIKTDHISIRTSYRGQPSYGELVDNPDSIRVAVPYYKLGQNLSGRKPDYFLHTTEDWLVLPYELQGLSIEDIIEHKPSVAHILGSVMKQP